MRAVPILQILTAIPLFLERCFPGSFPTQKKAAVASKDHLPGSLSLPQLLKALRAVADASSVKLRDLWQGAEPDERVVDMFCK